MVKSRKLNRLLSKYKKVLHCLILLQANFRVKMHHSRKSFQALKMLFSIHLLKKKEKLKPNLIYLSLLLNK